MLLTLYNSKYISEIFVSKANVITFRFIFSKIVLLCTAYNFLFLQSFADIYSSISKILLSHGLIKSTDTISQQNFHFTSR